MADNQLGVGSIILPIAKSDKERELNIALENFVRKTRQNIDYLLRPMVTTATTNYTATDLNHTVLCDASGGAFTVTLPEVAVSEGLLLNVKKIDSGVHAVTVDGSGSEVIDGSTTQSLSSQYDSIAIHCDGAAWYIIASK